MAGATADPDGDLRRGREALAAADWDTARACFERAREAQESADALDGLGDVAHFQRDYERALELKERAFVAFREAGRAAEAADVARWLAFMHDTFHGNFAVASGWMGRAESLLEGLEECAAHGWLALYRAPFTSDTAEREKVASAALAIARRYGDADLEYDALALLGETYVAAGRVAEGMRLLDEAMAAVAAGEVESHGAIGEICCRLLSACEHAVDLRRAEEWMAQADRHVVWEHFVRPTCRTYLGGILVALGQWPAAEAQLLDAIRAFERGYRGDRVYPLVRLADLRVRQGRYEEAERLLEDVDWHPIARQAAAAISLSRGELGLARDLARMCLEGVDAASPGCAPLMDLLVRIELDREEADAARETLERLTALAADTGDARVGAFAQLATGRVRRVEGDERAAGHFRAALEGFGALQMPLEAARAQLELAGSLAAGAPDAAIAEAKLALGKLERLGATSDADGAGALLRELGATGRAWPKGEGTLTRREHEVLALLAEGLPNAEIAQRLVISRRTAEHHVANVLSKLGLRSRAEAAAYAARSKDP